MVQTRALRMYDVRYPSMLLLRTINLVGTAIAVAGIALLMIPTLNAVQPPSMRAHEAFGVLAPLLQQPGITASVAAVVMCLGMFVIVATEMLKNKYHRNVPQGIVTNKWKRRNSSGKDTYFLSVDGYTLSMLRRSCTLSTNDRDKWECYEPGKAYSFD